MTPQQQVTGEFSHCLYDDITFTLFVYFNNPVVQNLQKDTDLPVEELVLWLKPDQYKKMRDYFIANPEPPVI